MEKMGEVPQSWCSHCSFISNVVICIISVLYNVEEGDVKSKCDVGAPTLIHPWKTCRRLDVKSKSDVSATAHIRLRKTILAFIPFPLDFVSLSVLDELKIITQEVHSPAM